ncbi:MAG: tetratricopeptide repeat protein [Bacteroidota bacterium]
MQVLLQGSVLASTGLDSAAYYLNRDANKAIAFGRRAILEGHRSGNLNDVLHLHKIIGVSYVRLGKQDSALIHFKATLEIARQTDNDAAIGAAFNNLGNYYVTIGKQETGLSNHMEALKYRRAANDSLGISRSLINIGIVQDELGRRKDARETYLQALKMKKLVKDRFGEGLVLHNLGILHAEAKEFEEAETYMRMALGIFQELDGVMMQAEVTTSMATMFYDRQDLETARNYVRKAFVLHDPVRSPASLSEAYMTLAAIENQEGQRDAALQNQRKGIEISLEGGFLPMVASGYLTLSSYFEQAQQPDSAFRYLKKYMELQRELQEGESLRLLEEMQAIHQTSIKEHIIQSRNQEISLYKKEQAFNIFIIVGLLVALALSVGLVVAIVIRNRTARALQVALADKLKTDLQLREKELELKSKELVGLALQIAQKNELLIDLEKQLKATTSSEATKGLERQIRSIVNNDKDWDEFSRLYEQVDESFYLKLNSAFSNLTVTDLRICALIRLRMSNKEIGRVMNISPDSVVKARYRIKKKMELDKEINLSRFIWEL